MKPPAVRGYAAANAGRRSARLVRRVPENLYKIYGESFLGDAHLKRVVGVGSV